MKRSGNVYLKGALLVLAFSAVAAYGYTAMGKEDMTAFLMWWLTLLVLGIGFMPLTMVVFRKFKDKGWLFSKTIGLAISGWLMCRLRRQ